MLVGLAGYARSGKDSVASILMEERGFRRIGFADAVKSVAYQTDVGIAHRVNIFGWEAVKDNPEVREYLQQLGMACRRCVGPDVWINAVFRIITEAFDNEGPARWVIPDVRFPNEVDAIRAYGGRVWRIQRPGVGPVNSHPSESALDCGIPMDQVIPNDGTVDDLRHLVLDLVDMLSEETLA